MNTIPETEAIARAICGKYCRISANEGLPCKDGEPCKATLDQLMLSQVWSEAEEVEKLLREKASG